jgi:hypothetical protein
MTEAPSGRLRVSIELETYPLDEVDFHRRGQASSTASILCKTGEDELLARVMKICLYPFVRLISGKTDQTITRKDEGVAEASWRQDCTLKGGVHALTVKEE